MGLIQWKNEFSVGDADIDDQHKQWINIYNTAHNRMLSKPSEDRLSLGKDALEAMIQYTRYHFSFEEKFMADAEYSNIEAHCQMHDNFSKKLDQLSLQFHREEHVLTSEIIKSIENWLVDHILKEDTKLNLF